MRILKNKFVVGILCILAGIFISFAALPSLQGNMQGSYESIIRMKGTIQAGTQITADIVETVNVPENLVHDGVKDISEAVGRYAKSGLYAGDYLTHEKISVLIEKENALTAGTEKGKMVVSVTIPSLASGVSGRLLAGDIVTVIALPKGDMNQSLGVEPRTAVSGDAGVVVYPELRYLEICMVTAGDGADANVEGKPEEKNTLPETVSFYVNEQQALRLAELEQNSVIQLAFVARGEAAAQFIPDTDRISNMEVR
jgi:pilus assembly protein CpaB